MLLKNYNNSRRYLFIISEKYIILFIIKRRFAISEKGRATVAKFINSIANSCTLSLLRCICKVKNTGFFPPEFCYYLHLKYVPRYVIWEHLVNYVGEHSL